MFLPARRRVCRIAPTLGLPFFSPQIPLPQAHDRFSRLDGDNAVENCVRIARKPCLAWLATRCPPKRQHPKKISQRLPTGYPRSDRLQSKTLPGSIARSVGTLPMNTTPALISRHSPALNSLKRFVASSPAAGIALKT